MQDNSQVRGVGVISIKGGRGGGNTQSVGHQEWRMQNNSQVGVWGYINKGGEGVKCSQCVASRVEHAGLLSGEGCGVISIKGGRGG